jgi:hypothetical protein
MPVVTGGEGDENYVGFSQRFLATYIYCRIRWQVAKKVIGKLLISILGLHRVGLSIRPPGHVCYRTCFLGDIVDTNL